MSYAQGFMDKCAENGVEVSDVIKFLVPIMGASAVGAMLGIPVGAIRRDMTARQGMISGAAVGAGAGIGKQLVKKLVTPHIIKNSSGSVPELVKDANVLSALKGVGGKVLGQVPNVVAGSYDHVVTALRSLLTGGKKPAIARGVQAGRQPTYRLGDGK